MVFWLDINLVFLCRNLFLYTRTPKSAALRYMITEGNGTPLQYSSLELATEVPPGISTLISGLKTPLTLAGGVLIGLPVLTFMCLFCCFCFKAAASAAHELPWFLGREKPNCWRNRLFGFYIVWCWNPACFYKTFPSPKPQATWGRIGWGQALKVKLFFMAWLKIILPEPPSDTARLTWLDCLDLWASWIMLEKEHRRNILWRVQ